MTRLVVADDVVQAFPALRITVIVAAGFDGRGPWPELDERFAALEAAGEPVPGEGDPHIAAWHAAYRAFGTNPRRQRLTGLLASRSRSLAGYQVTPACPATPDLDAAVPG